MRTVRVKISSEAAGTISLTPVVVQEIAFDELIGSIARLTGKDRQRVEEVLRRGTVVSGGSRLRWQVFEPEAADITAAFNKLPDPEPSRHFDRRGCRHIVLRGGATSVTITREAGSKRRLFARTSFWDQVMASAPDPQYVTYSYADRADVYRFPISDEQRAALLNAAALLAYPALIPKVRALSIEQIDFYCPR